MTTTTTDPPPPPPGDWQYNELTALAQRAGVPREKLAPILTILWPVYYRYDADAARSQNWFRRGAVAVYCLSGLAVAVAIGQLLFVPAANPLVALEVLAMVAALLLLTSNPSPATARTAGRTRLRITVLLIFMFLTFCSVFVFCFGLHSPRVARSSFCPLSVKGERDQRLQVLWKALILPG